MGINLLNIEPHKVSTDLNGYIVYIYGRGGVGKTYLASQIPGALLFAFEKGYNAIQGIMAQDIRSWSDFKQAVMQLNNPKVKERFKAIVIDTIDIACSMCEEYICKKYDVDQLSDIGYGKGYKVYNQELESTMRSITQLGYALFFISHEKDKVIKLKDGTEYNEITPSLSPASNSIIRNMADIQGYAFSTSTGDGGSSNRLILRSKNGDIECKSRFKCVDEEIPFNYESLVDCINNAIKREAEMTDKQYITDEPIKQVKEIEYDFKKLVSEFNEIVMKLRTKFADDFNEKCADRIRHFTDEYLGKGKRVVDCNDSQSEQIVLIIEELKREFDL